MRARTGLSTKERRQLKLSGFRGVDFSSSVTEISPLRAARMRNFINRGGVNHKRNGWNEILQIEGSPRINGVFSYGDDVLIIHAGTDFYRVKKEDGRPLLIPSREKITPTGVIIKDQRSQAFSLHDRLYIVGCGDIFVFDGKKMRKACDDPQAHIPVTSRIYPNKDLRTPGVVEALEAPNLLTRRRKNFLFGTKDPEAALYDSDGRLNGWLWELDDSDAFNVEITLERLEGDSVSKYIIKTEVIKERTVLKIASRSGGYSQELDIEEVVGMLAGRYLLFTVTTDPLDEEEPNITVAFDTGTKYYDTLFDTTFGIVYGVNGNLDRLFLSGNAKCPATVFYSAMDDFTYFPDVNTVSVGVSSVPITAFARLSDSALAVFKKDSALDASLYVLGGTYTSTEDESGAVTSFSALFPKSAGAEGEGALNAHTCANLAGDTLVLSKNGVFGVVLQENVMTTVRYTRERSRAIAEKLKSHENLADAVSTVHDGRYYLVIDGACYVADARHKYTADANDGSFNYEWWYWDNIPARVWTELGGKLAFGSDDGRVFVFDDTYTDKRYRHTVSGELALSGKGGLSCEQDLYKWIEDGAEISLEGNTTEGQKWLYAIQENDVIIENGRVQSKTDIFFFHEGMVLYAVGTDLVSGKQYTVTDIDFGEGTYALRDENGALVQSSGAVSLYRSLSEERLYIEKSEGELYLKETREGNRRLLATYMDITPTDITAIIKESTPVVAEWITPVFDLGTNAHSKTLLKMTIATAPEIRSKLSFGYETRNVLKILSKKGQDVFSFEDFSFNAFSFDTGFANSYSVRCNERNFNYILFRFLADDEGDCAISDFSIVYKINRENKGVR